MSIADEIFKGTARYHKKFNKMCQPIMRYFGVNAVTYVDINSQGKLINLHTHLPWMERCMTQEYYKDDHGMVHPDNVCSGFAIGEEYQRSEDTDAMLQDCIDNYDMFYSCYFIEKNNKSYQLFGFDAPKANHKLVDRVSNEFNIFKRMIRTMQQELHEHSVKLEPCITNLATIKGDAFLQQGGIMQLNIEENKNKLEMLKSFGLIKSNILNISLSTQEKRCLRLCLENNTAKQIASHLNLSPKTVSGYLDNVKNKLGCNYKSDLINAAEILESLGML